MDTRTKNSLREWQDEKKWQEKVLKDAKATPKQKEYAKKRIAEAETYIKRIKSEK